MANVLCYSLSYRTHIVIVIGAALMYSAARYSTGREVSRARHCKYRLSRLYVAYTLPVYGSLLEFCSFSITSFGDGRDDNGT